MERATANAVIKTRTLSFMKLIYGNLMEQDYGRVLNIDINILYCMEQPQLHVEKDFSFIYDCFPLRQSR